MTSPINIKITMFAQCFIQIIIYTFWVSYSNRLPSGRCLVPDPVVCTNNLYPSGGDTFSPRHPSPSSASESSFDEYTDSSFSYK